MSTSKQFTRRSFLRGLGIGAALPWLETVGSLAAWADTSMDGKTITRYPDPALKSLTHVSRNIKLATLLWNACGQGARWSEGPVWFGDGGFLLWSDIPNNRILKWQEVTGEVSTYRKPSNYTNGHTRDRQGRLVSCEHGTRRVTRTEYDGTVTVLIDNFNGKRFNAPTMLWSIPMDISGLRIPDTVSSSTMKDTKPNLNCQLPSIALIQTPVKQPL